MEKEKETSIFDSIIYNRNQLLFIIEDTEGNKFESYINTTITTVYWITDPNAFVLFFSLESNGKLQEPTKFTRRNPQHAF